jgi:phosphoribosylanthranilate isomerase
MHLVLARGRSGSMLKNLQSLRIEQRNAIRAKQIEGGALQPDYLLLDSMKGGSGVALDWEAVSTNVPAGESLHGWLLAGGLTADNVALAADIAQPSGVDVSSGVCLENGASVLVGTVNTARSF